MSDPEHVIMSLLEQEHGISRAKLVPTSRLAQDLGVDGDDAVDLFQRVHERFGTDFTALDGHWTEFFAHEGASARSMLIGLGLLIPSSMMTVMVATAFSLSDGLAGLIGVALFFVLWTFVGKLMPAKQARPLTIYGLAEIVQRGEWPTDPAQVR